MTPQNKIGVVALRIAVATNVGRVRNEDAVRAMINGGANGDLMQRTEAVVMRLEKVAEKLEAAIT